MTGTDANDRDAARGATESDFPCCEVVGEGSDAQKAREARYAEAIRDRIKALTPPPVIGTGGGLSLGATEFDMARAVVAVADAELAEARAEVTKWRLFAHGETIRAEAAEAKLRDVEALHRRRSWDWHKDSATFGQSEYPDQCDHCHRSWPCETAAVLARSQAPQP